MDPYYEPIAELLRTEGGVWARRNNLTIRHQLEHLVQQGQLRALLPGVYTDLEPTWQARIRAAGMFRPDCVITGAAAAVMTWWPECPITAVCAATKQPVRTCAKGFNWERRSIPADLVVDSGVLRVASPALSVLDLIPILGGAVIDEALRRQSVTLEHLAEAFRQTPARPGNRQRAALIHDSRDRPWSPAERTAHHLLRQAGINGWRTNRRVMVKGVGYVVDLVFQQQRVAVEIDGWSYHGSRESFIKDRWRYARLAAAGWCVLPFAASELDDAPDEFVAVVRDALRMRAQG